MLPCPRGLRRRSFLAWCSRSFTSLASRSGRRERAGLVGVAAREAVAEAALEVRVVDDRKEPHDANHDDHQQGDAAADQACRQRRFARRRRLSVSDRRLTCDGPPGGAVPVREPIVGDPTTLSVLARHSGSLRPPEAAAYSGMLPCQRGLRRRSLRRAIFRARISSPRVRPGSITSSMYPRSAAI